APRREDGEIVPAALTVRRLDVLSQRVEARHAGAADEADPVAVGPLRGLGDDAVGAGSAEHLAEQDPVVGAALLFAEDRDLVAPRGLALHELVEETAGAHAVADDRERLSGHAQAALSGAPARPGPTARARTAQTLNSGMRLAGSSAGIVSRFAACLPPPGKG